MQETNATLAAAEVLRASSPPDEMEQRIAMLKSLTQQQRHSMNFVPPSLLLP